MPTINLKRGVDLPVWEWIRPLPVASTTLSNWVAGGKPASRYLYYLANTTSGIFRYDCYTDGWSQLTASNYSQVSPAACAFNSKHGYTGRIIESTGDSTMRCAVPKGNKCVGKKITIILGTGAGQTREITAVSDPEIHSTLSVTFSTQQEIGDSTKNFAVNQWRDYGLRIVGNSATDFRKIIYNTNTVIGVADNRFSAYGLPWAYSPLLTSLPSGAGVEAIAHIESHIITVDSPWDTAPDNTSVFVIESGMLWNINVASNRFTFQSYDVLNDSWYSNNSVAGGYLSGNLATDVALESLNAESVGEIFNRNVVSALAKQVVLDGATITSNLSSKEIVIVSGKGAGQRRLITSNTGNTLSINRYWSEIPDNTSVASITVDNDKIFMIGNVQAALYEYDAVNDVWSDRRILEVGNPTNICAVWKGYKRPIGLTSITRSGTTATANSTLPHGLKVGDVISVYGASQAAYNVVNATITSVANTSFNYEMASDPGSSASAAFSQSTTLLVDPSKSWAVNEHVGKVLSFTTTAFSATAGLVTVYVHAVITANTATTISFNNIAASPSSGTVVYTITDARAHGAIHTSLAGAGSTTTIINLATPLAAGTTVAGRRVTIADGFNYTEAAIDVNATNGSSITLSAALTFTPSTNAVINILGNSPSGDGCSLTHLYGIGQGDYIFSMRGGNTNNLLKFDIASDSWEVLNQMPNAEVFTSGSMSAYDGANRVYMQPGVTGRILYYDFTDNNLYGFSQIPFGMATFTRGNKMAIVETPDNLKFLYIARHSGREAWRTLLWI